MSELSKTRYSILFVQEKRRREEMKSGDHRQVFKESLLLILYKLYVIYHELFLKKNEESERENYQQTKLEGILRNPLPNPYPIL